MEPILMSDIAALVRKVAMHGIRQTVLIRLAWAAPSARSAFRIAREHGWTGQESLDCKMLTRFRLRYGNELFIIFVRTLRAELNLSFDKRELCFCTCHQCKKCFSQHSHDVHSCRCSCHRCACCLRIHCFCSCHRCDSCETWYGPFCTHRHHCSDCTPVRNKQVNADDENYDLYDYYDNDEEEVDISYRRYTRRGRRHSDYEDSYSLIDKGDDKANPNDTQKLNSEDRLKNVVKMIEKQTGRKVKCTYKDDKLVNASCDADGTVTVHGALLEHVDDDELAHIIGHEITHDEKKHYAKRKQLSDDGFIATKKVADQVTGGKLEKFVGKAAVYTIGVVLSSVADKQLSRQNEKDADVGGAKIAADAGFDSDAGITLFDKIGHDSEGIIGDALSTHPTRSERVRNLKEHEDEYKRDESEKKK